MAIVVRRATAADVPAITRIYNEGIVDRLATLETEERTEEERAAWLAARGERHPALVAEIDGVVAGWGSLNPFSPRPAYRWVADFSVYIARDRRGQGIGSALLAALEETARELAYHKLVLAAFPFNTAGMALYRRHGFQTVGIYHEQGQLDGGWVDTIVMEKLLG
jgi:L-amino acid N-acyltransferase YncA